MSVMEILSYPDSRLKRKSSLVTEFDESLSALIDAMFETMYSANGIGLAAPQVNVHKDLLVMDLSEEREGGICLINPEIVYSEGEVESEEGCLSVPGVNEKVLRAEKIRVEALDRSGQPLEIEADGLLAICIQHEIDHLNGRLFIDYLSNMKRLRIRKRVEKEMRQA